MWEFDLYKIFRNECTKAPFKTTTLQCILCKTKSWFWVKQKMKRTHKPSSWPVMELSWWVWISRRVWTRIHCPVYWWRVTGRGLQGWFWWPSPPYTWDVNCGNTRPLLGQPPAVWSHVPQPWSAAPPENRTQKWRYFKCLLFIYCNDWKILVLCPGRTVHDCLLQEKTFVFVYEVEQIFWQNITRHQDRPFHLST